MDPLIWWICIFLLIILFAILIKNIIQAVMKIYRSIKKRNVEHSHSYSHPYKNTQDNSYTMKAYYKQVHYPALRVISIVLQIFSILVFAAGLIGSIFMFTSDDDIWELGIITLGIAITNALLLLAIAELIIVLADISISTRATLNQVIDATARKAETENKH